MCSKKEMELLFDKGNSVTHYPVKCMFIETQAEMKFAAQAMFVAPKRNFKKSPDRNTLKRRMREAYRLNKHLFYEALNAQNKKIVLAFIYIGKKEEDYAAIESAVIKSLKKITSYSLL